MLGARTVLILCVAVGLSAGSILVSTRIVRAQSTVDLQAQIDAQTAQVSQINQEIAKYEAEIAQANADKATLQNAIHTLDLERQKVEAQISATQRQISATQLQIRQLGQGIANAQSAINTDQAAVGATLRTMQQADAQSLVVQLFTANSLTDAWNDVDTAMQIQTAVKAQIAELAVQKSSLIDSQTATKQKQDALNAQKSTLASQKQSLTQTQKSKGQLLAETNANEATYQKLLAQAKAELASFSAFTANAGGSGLLPHQTSCDSWGCYYNQRDVAWGNQSLNGTRYALKSDGCLVTSMAMLVTHYGYRDVTPVTINANPSNFAAYYPAYLLFTISVDGMTVTRKSTYIDSTLATGNPVVVGLNAYGGTHYVVLVSGSKGNYVMKDPYVPNGNDIPFTSHYSLKQVFGVAKVVISS
jgi:peptidoglycan hydrolase CwlO-like protein